MKSVAMKFLAILLATTFLLTGIASVLGMVVMSVLEANGETPDELHTQELYYEARAVAYAKVRAYQIYQNSTAPREVVDWGINTGMVDASYVLSSYGLEVVGWIITDSSGQSHSEGDMTAKEGRYSFFFEAISPSYEIIVPTDEVQGPKKDTFGYGGISYSILRQEGQMHSVEVMVEISDMPDEWDALFSLYAMGDMLPLFLIASLLLFGVCMVYLCWVAGKKKGQDEIRPGGLNALPLDLYGVIMGGLGISGVFVASMVIDLFDNNGFSWMLVWLLGALAWGICLLPVAFVFAVAAQVKCKNFFWLRRSVMGFLLIRLWRGVRWVNRGARWLCCCFGEFLRMIPAIWQWLLTAALMVLVPVFWLVCVALARRNFWYSFFQLMFFVSLAVDLCLPLYGGWCFGKLLKGAKRMAGGDLDTKIDTKYLVGSFLDCAIWLNELSDAAMIAAREKMKSERMRTELITNVSHDIKTPLTSLINYVDLLQQPHTEEEGQQYLEVLSRQSARLKKLIEDLMEMSKASTGNVTTQITEIHAAEAIHQALGEFADKLHAVGVTAVIRMPEEPVAMRADGRLTWRVMSNLLSNVVKYALPGTRLYVDVQKAEGKVRISFKNISAEPLNISASELMERFVRGDASRNTEGSGLGLNIAASLMEVQSGTMEVKVDGDLFKVTLSFPCS